MAAVARETYDDLEGHQRIPELLRELEAAADLSGLKGKLTELRDELESHFAMEERAGGFFEELCEVQPTNVPKIRGLTEQHGTILTQTDTLLGDLTAGSLEGALPAVKELCKVIRGHDEEEHQLFLDSYMVDHGGA